MINNNYFKLPGQRKRCKSSSSLTSSRISTDYIANLLDQLSNQHVRQSTKENYLVIWRAFNKFLVRLDKQLFQQFSEERAAFFGAFLTDQGVQSSTLKSYFSAIKFMVKLSGYDWDDNRVVISTLVKSCRLKNDQVLTRLPIQHKLLEALLFELERMFENQWYLQVMYKALFMMAYFGLMRVGELTETTIASDHALRACDVHRATNKNKFLLVLYHSKTHGKESQPQYITIYGTEYYNARQRFFCPFRVIRRYINMRGDFYSQNEHFFVFQDGSNVKANHFRSTLKTALEHLNFNPDLFNTHSFRIGMTTDLFKAGFSVELIKRIGQWRSNIVYRYIK